jgi:DnaK suppressor protein
VAKAPAAQAVASKSVSTTVAKKATPKKAATNTTPKSAPATKAPTKAAAKKTAPAKPAIKKAPAKSAAPAAATKAAPTKAVTKKAAPTKAVAKKQAPAKKAPAAAKAPATAKAPAAKAPARTSGGGVPKRKPGPGPYATDTKFLDEIRLLLDSERAVYQEQATALKAEADSLAQEREPGDVQFDEESGEGGTVTVDRERDLALSAQASLAVEEIDDALERVKDKSYGACERCQQPIPKARLRALPYARLCVACKSGGLSRR